MRWSRGYIITARAAVAGAALAGYMLALALASSPHLHDLFHHDAEQRQHVCLATTLHAGHGDPVAAVVIAAKPAATPQADVAPRDAEIAGSFYLRCRLLKHGPPDLLLS